MLSYCGEHAGNVKEEEPAEAAAEDTADSPGEAAPTPRAAPDTGGDDAMTGDAPTPYVAPPTPAVEAPAAAPEEKKEPESMKYQAVATIGIALIAMGEDVGAEMALRQFQHLVSCSRSRQNPADRRR